MGDEPSHRPADAFAQLGSDLKEGVNPKYHISRDLFNLIPLKENPKLSFTFAFYLNEIFLGPDITSRNSWQWFLASLGYPHKFLALLVLLECQSTSCIAQCIMHRWVTPR